MTKRQQKKTVRLSMLKLTDTASTVMGGGGNCQLGEKEGRGIFLRKNQMMIYEPLGGTYSLIKHFKDILF